MKKTLIPAVAALTLILAGSAQAQVSAEIVLGSPPPAVREEVIPAPPGAPAQWVWHKGHQRWIDGIYVWVPGHWVKKPRPEAVWVEPEWVQRPNGSWAFHEGHWVN